MLLMIDACMRSREQSRTWRMGAAFLKEYQKHHPGETVETLCARTQPLPCFNETLSARRDALIAAGKLDHPDFRPARLAAGADEIVVCAPYWDLSFPAALKAVVEHLCVNQIAFVYTDQGQKGLYKAKRLTYLTSAGGFIGENNLGGLYFEKLCPFLGIREFRQVSAEGLDIVGADVGAILQKAEADIKALF